MSSHKRLSHEHPPEETYVYDQCCRNCKYYWMEDDRDSGKQKYVCHNRNSGAYLKKPESKWCWMWEDKDGPDYGVDYDTFPGWRNGTEVQASCSEDDYSEDSGA